MKKLLLVRLPLVSVLCLACCSCAFMNRRNRPVMNFIEEHAIPENTTAKYATAPLTLPLWLVGGVVDTAFIHPHEVLDDARVDTYAVWRSSGSGIGAEIALFPLRVVGTPLVYTLSWLNRSIFDIPAVPPKPARLDRELNHRDPRMRALAVRDISHLSYKGADIPKVTEVITRTVDKFTSDKNEREYCVELTYRLPAPLTDEAVAWLVKKAEAGKGALCKAAIDRLFWDMLNPQKLEYSQEEVEHFVKVTNSIAKLYDNYLVNSHREAEVYIAYRSALCEGVPQAAATSFYIVRSLAERNWPSYAERVAFLLQRQLLRYSPTSHLEAVQYEWRALRVQANWPEAVAAALSRLKAGGPGMKPQFVKDQDAVSKEIRAIKRGEAFEMTSLYGVLLAIKTQLDAEELAEELLKGSEREIMIFMSKFSDLSTLLIEEEN